MNMRHAIERIAVADARRFEEGMRGLQKQVLEKCRDDATRRIIEELIAEEEEHLRQLDEISAPEVRGEDGKQPVLRGETLCEMLKEILAMEEAAGAFYGLMVKRTSVPVVREVFGALAAAERGHESRLADHVREVCGDPDDA